MSFGLALLWLAAAPPGPATCLADGSFPARLSETGCYRDLARGLPAGAAVPYEVNAPLWTDGAEKRRWIALPPGRRVRVDGDGGLRFPEGAVLIKEFRLAGRPVETRLMLRTADGWKFRTYEWNTAGTEAAALTRGKRIELPHPDGKPVAYAFPSEQECTACHSAGGATEALGTTLAQLSRHVLRDGRRVDQLGALAPLFEGGPPPRARAPLADPQDAAAPLERRARAWLHANCAHCHRPGGWSPPTLTLDLRWELPLADTHTCGESTQYFTIAPRIEPRRPERSAVWRRIRSRGTDHMPPVGALTTDPGAVVVRDWIAALERCP